MKNQTIFPEIDNLIPYEELLEINNEVNLNFSLANSISYFRNRNRKTLPEILLISPYPPNQSGISNNTHDLIHAIRNKFSKSFSLKVCALQQNADEYLDYPNEVKYVLNTNKLEQYDVLAQSINDDTHLDIVFIQHEFNLYGGIYGDYLLQLLAEINKTVITTFHSVLPNPDKELKTVVQSISTLSNGIVVMNQNSANILINQYEIPAEKITVIAYGTLLVGSLDSYKKCDKNYFGNRLILSTFGSLNSDINIETALDAMPKIMAEFPNILYLVIGKNHPDVTNNQSEKYRNFLHEKVISLRLQDHVKFIDKHLSINELLEYFKRTDIYLFTSNDQNPVIGGTLVYAFASGCVVVSTPILLGNDTMKELVYTFDLGNSSQLADAIINLLQDEKLRKEISNKGLRNTAIYAFENSAIAHAKLFEKMSNVKQPLKYTLPKIDLSHLQKLTTDFGIVQLSQFDTPDLESGYTVNVNAKALIAICQHYEITRDKADLEYIKIFLEFIQFCQQSEGYFLNYVDKNRNFTAQNNEINIADSNGIAIWGIGYVISIEYILPVELIDLADEILEKAIPQLEALHSTRSMAFVIKGLTSANQQRNSPRVSIIIKTLANRIVQLYNQESEQDWQWFESYLSHANSILPEAMLCAYEDTGSIEYMKIARESFDFLLSKIFHDDQIKVVSNRSGQTNSKEPNQHGELPTDVAYTIMTLSRFYDIFKDKKYGEKMENAFNWFLGKNHLSQIIYNPSTGGCYDELEETSINLNQGAESTVSYLMSRLTLEKYEKQSKPLAISESIIEEMEFELVQS